MGKKVPAFGQPFSFVPPSHTLPSQDYQQFTSRKKNKGNVAIHIFQQLKQIWSKLKERETGDTPQFVGIFLWKDLDYEKEIQKKQPKSAGIYVKCPDNADSIRNISNYRICSGWNVTF